MRLTSVCAPVLALALFACGESSPSVAGDGCESESCDGEAMSMGDCLRAHDAYYDLNNETATEELLACLGESMDAIYANSLPATQAGIETFLENDPCLEEEVILGLYTPEYCDARLLLAVGTMMNVSTTEPGPSEPALLAIDSRCVAEFNIAAQSANIHVSINGLIHCLRDEAAPVEEALAALISESVPSFSKGAVMNLFAIAADKLELDAYLLCETRGTDSTAALVGDICGAISAAMWRDMVFSMGDYWGL